MWILIPSRDVRRDTAKCNESRSEAEIPTNIVWYKTRRRDGIPLVLTVISGTYFNRCILLLASGAKGGRTIIFPNSVRNICAGAFYENTQLRSAILNEGLEKLAGSYDGNRYRYDVRGLFANTKLQRI